MAAIGLTVVLAGAAAAPLLFTSSGGTGAGGAPSLTARTLLRLPAASALAQGGGAAYVTDDLRDLLVRFDPGSGRVEGSVHLAGRPTAMVLAGGDLWVADMVDNQVVEVDTHSLRVVRSVSVPAGPSSLAVAGGFVWVASVVAGQLTPIDPVTATARPAESIPGGAVRVAAGYGALWVTGTTDTLTRVDLGNPLQLSRSAVTVGSGPIGVATGAGSVWVADAQGGSVSQVDPSSRAVVHTYRVGGDPFSIAVAAGRVYVGDGTAQSVRTVSPAPGARVLGIGTTPRQLLPVGGAVWVAGADPGRVLSVATRSRSRDARRARAIRCRRPPPSGRRAPRGCGGPGPDHGSRRPSVRTRS